MTRDRGLHPVFRVLLLGLIGLNFHGRGLVFGRMEAQFEKCCSLGTSWALEGLRCEKFTGPVAGVPTVEQGLCLEAVDICCVRAYHEQQCEKGKADARAGLACVTGNKPRNVGRGDYHRDCCEGCKLGILTGSMGQGCSFKTFSFGIPWDPAFLECCHEASPNTTTTFSTSSDATSESTETDLTSSPSTFSSLSSFYSTSSGSSPLSSSTSSGSSPLSSATFSGTSPLSSSASSGTSPLSSSTSSGTSPLTSSTSPGTSPFSSSTSSLSSSSSPSSNSSTTFSSSSPSSSSTSSSSSSSSSKSSSSTSFSPSIPTPPLDDICQLMKGQLCSDICVPTPGSYYCKCREGFTLLEDGKTCRQDLPTDRCKTSNPCEQRCTDNGVAVTCSCNPGYILAEDKRSCNPVTSRNKPSEEDNELSPICPAGYRYNSSAQVCDDIDECAEGLDSCGDEICYNQPGGYSCARAPSPMTRKPATTPLPAPANQKCVSGTRFVRNRGCVDIDECREFEDACSSNEECINTMGSYTCSCKTGFRRDNLTQACVDINECQLQENDCLSTQRCDNTIGSYTCTRFLPCGTGYTLNAATEICEDDDECALGTHDCGEGYHCRNTLGSYRCDRNPRGPMTQARISTTPATTTTLMPTTSSSYTTVRSNCPQGFEPGSGGKCVDIDECQMSNPCGRTSQRCINTLGSYRCVSRVICGNGYTLDPTRGQRCVDIDECADGSHECTSQQTCENRQGGYVCKCPAGYADGPNKDCVDIDECSIYGSQVCGSNSKCENTVGSYRCSCEDGFENVGGPSGSCQDVDECQQTPGICQHVCVNIWGSYRCGCEAGFRLNADNRSCSDIDECTEFKNNNLCIGVCENTPGSYACKCPEGYRLGVDGRTCQDIDECATGRVCRDPEEICQNTRGGFRCNRIDCPPGYYRDRERKNRCVKASRYCPVGDLACFRSPSHYSYNFITFISMLPIPPSGQLELFTMRGTHLPGSTIQFSMALVDARAPPGIARATESCFALRRPAPSQAVLVMTKSIPGPQEIELELSMEIYHNTIFAGSAVAKLFIFVSQYEF